VRTASCFISVWGVYRAKKEGEKARARERESDQEKREFFGDLFIHTTGNFLYYHFFIFFFIFGAGIINELSLCFFWRENK